ncbi:hypothetical protein D0C36_12905 [Mucilaginibacter conchicola]|uniref:DUF6377 domain-containing protein n=1 Tax=Mucilaginibacter conchicola TaxID=2303333 RepID=A0A372NUP6_9SPHI|nr:DUF6377 domain-containing protein [Mucilaginibacter conchicola]RFZ92327.1 hypothetical protein D0C36_12905 [Mucilaginibacter conchicola]
MKKRTSILAAFLLTMVSAYASNPRTDSLWKVLKTELSKEPRYIDRKEQKILLLRQRLSSIPDTQFSPRFTLLSQLFDEYSSFKFDSAVTSVNRMIDLSKRFHKQDELIKSRMAMVTVLLKSGFYKEAFEAVALIDTAVLSKQTRHEFLNLRAMLYAEVSAYDNDAFFAKSYKQASQRDYRSAASIITPDELEQMTSRAFLPETDRNRKPTAEFYYRYFLDNHLTEHQVAMAATLVSHAYQGDDKLLLLMLASISDIRSATKETFAIFLLGQEFFKLNRNGDAYICIKEALGNAAFYGTRNRAAQIESVLPLIASRLLEEKQHEKDMVWIGLGIVMLVAVVLVFQLVLFRKQVIRIKVNEQVIKEKNAELQDVNGMLWQSSKIKEELIGLFFKTCSSYIETLEKVKRKTQHNIKLGKYQDATTVLGNVQIQQEKTQLYSTLDSVLLTLFPNFVASFNSLLNKEDQIWLKKGEMLTPTIRIFALIRLGVTDIETIAKILDYTVNTVYTYRARVKAKAIVEPEVFEQKIMEIKFTDEF